MKVLLLMEAPKSKFRGWPRQHTSICHRSTKNEQRLFQPFCPHAACYDSQTAFQPAGIWLIVLLSFTWIFPFFLASWSHSFTPFFRFPGCPRDDLRRFRLLNDLPAALWLQQRGFQLPDRSLLPAVGHADAGLLPWVTWRQNPHWSGEVNM